jgi:hypothetical protein
MFPSAIAYADSLTVTFTSDECKELNALARNGDPLAIQGNYVTLSLSDERTMGSLV